MSLLLPVTHDLACLSHEFSDSRPNLISDVAKNSQALIFTAVSLRWVFEAPVQTGRLDWQDRAGFSCAITNGYHIVKVLADERVNVLRVMAGDIDPDLIHDFDGLGANFGGMCACAVNFKGITTVM